MGRAETPSGGPRKSYHNRLLINKLHKSALKNRRGA